MPFKEDLLEGSYFHVKDQAYVDFCVQQGFPKAEAEKLLGTKWWCHVRKSGGDWTGWTECEERADLHVFMSFKDGESKELEWFQLGPGKKKLKCNFFDNGFTLCVADSPIGWDEVYTKEGMNIVMKMNGKEVGYRELWTRVRNETGWFKFDKSENLEPFLKATGWPDDLIKAMPELKWHWQKDGNDCFKWYEDFGNASTLRIRGKFKTDGSKGFFKACAGDTPLDREITCVRRKGKFLEGEDVHYYEFFDGGKKGETWERAVLPNGQLLLCGFHEKTGLKCKFWMTPFINYVGRYEIRSKEGFDTFGAVMGMPQSNIDFFTNDEGTHMILSEDAGYVRYQFISGDGIPQADFAFKWNEEHEHSWSMMPGHRFRAVDHWTGNTILSLKKMKGFTVRGIGKVTENFLVQTWEAVGTPGRFKLMMERVD